MCLDGVAGALSRFPATSRPTPTIPLTGRDDELDALRATEGDLLILGKAGIGKTLTGRDDELDALRATEGDLLILGKACSTNY